MKWGAFCTGVLLAAVALPSLARIEVHVEGAVGKPGTLTLKDSARLSDAALAARILPDAYTLGAAWLRPSLVPEQTRLKAGVLFDVGSLHRQALLNGDVTLAETTLAFRNWIAQMPVTGREVPVQLAPRVVEATPQENWPLAPGDTLFYPSRPSTVRIVGAVQRACSVPFRPLTDARRYLIACPAAPDADKNWVWVIQPDGRTFRRGIALWNLSDQALPLAPGAVIYVPLNMRITHAVDSDLDHDVVEFLATQTLHAPTPSP
jgi:Capsule biosynthesis GfcC C-terminal/Capsule biosynthesis GfcC, N-terminal